MNLSFFSFSGFRKELSVPVYLLSEFLILVFILSGIRLAFFLFHSEFWNEIPARDILTAFGVGLWFDTVVSCYVLSIPALLLFLPGKSLTDSWLFFVRGLISVLSLIVFLMGLADIKYYEFFGNHLDHFAFDYLDEPGEVIPMLWQQFPVITYFTLFTVLAGLYLFVRHRLLNLKPAVKPRAVYNLGSLTVFLLTVFVLFIGIRGKITSIPIQWGDAYVTDYEFSNQLGLNPVFTFFNAMLEEKEWKTYFKNPEELNRVLRSNFVRPGEVSLSEGNPLIRTVTGRGEVQGKPNLVFIILESWRADMTGSLGDSTRMTPAFDSLAANGILFEQFYASGIRSNRGILSAMASFPGYRGGSLMKKISGLTEFPTVATILKPEGWKSASFIYGGDQTFDNMKSFLRNNGFDSFTGVEDFPKSDYGSHWGASDKAMFRRSAVELSKMKEPFISLIFTLSTHEPFTYPGDLVENPKVNASPRRNFYNLMSYSDEALGSFFHQIKNEPFYKNTIFIICADHTKKFDDPSLSSKRFHIPALIYSPLLAHRKGEQIKTPAGHADLVPTVLGLLEGQFTINSWGRDVLSLREDEGFVQYNSNDYSAIVSGKEVRFLALKNEETFSTDLAGNHINPQNPSQSFRLDSLNKAITQGSFEFYYQKKNGLGGK